MKFERFFQLISYAAVFCGFFSLSISGTFGMPVIVLFLAVMIAAWFMEGWRWQIPERLGTALIVLTLPLYYLGFKFGFFNLSNSETMLPGILARLILSLTGIKLLQHKSDRDWIFLYLMSFFEVLLAAGLSISALYFGSFLLYLLVMICAVIAFEIRKTAGGVAKKVAAEAVKMRLSDNDVPSTMPAGKLPVVGFTLIVFIILLATPLFFMLPRVGGAGLGGNQKPLRTSGFSEQVELGDIGKIQLSDDVVMMVHMTKNEPPEDLYWRGAALDTFDNKLWSKSKPRARELFEKGDHDAIQLGYATDLESQVLQTIYLEPLDTQVLFALPLAVAVRGNLPFVYKDIYEGLTFLRNGERISYTVSSDRSVPPVEGLRADNEPYVVGMQNYLQLPDNYDKRIFNLASRITQTSAGRYDKAKALEFYLQNNFGYTLEPKAGGREPLADFLFSVREGHCEYFATAMAVMLRTQGIATRIVNGFHGGDYNDAVDLTIVHQFNAHSWVEVYFPKENAWVPFDPTPFAGGASTPAGGIAGQFKKYFEAIDAVWTQYFVSFDNQEQRSLMRSAQRKIADYQGVVASVVNNAQEMLAGWWADVRGDKGLQSRLAALGFGIIYLAVGALGILLLIWIYRKLAQLAFWEKLADWLKKKNQSTIVEFYQRMQLVLANSGFRREPYQTPLEFAYSLGIVEAVNITEKYNCVRFGERQLSKDEQKEIENWLAILKEKRGSNTKDQPDPAILSDHSR